MEDAIDADAELEESCEVKLDKGHDAVVRPGLGVGNANLSSSQPKEDTMKPDVSRPG